jgi:hypothetical protein
MRQDQEGDVATEHLAGRDPHRRHEVVVGVGVDASVEGKTGDLQREVRAAGIIVIVVQEIGARRRQLARHGRLRAEQIEADRAFRRLRIERRKNSRTALSSNDGEFVTSTTTSAPVSASWRPSPVRLLTPVDGEAATT